MERLTKRIDLGNRKYTADFSNERCGEFLTDHKAGVRALFERLAAYEDAEEQGLLIRFPCKVGDTLFWVIQQYDEENESTKSVIKELEVIGYGGNKLNPVVVTAQDRKMTAYKFSISAFGRRIFLTSEEAEAALKEMEG